MKTYFSHVVIALLMINALTAQVKIGDNPETLNPASVLELESSSRVLVITRVSDAQMNLINPLRGALVYNTDHDCLHYYTGTEWVNICEALDNSFTVSTRADYLRPLNPEAKDSTVVITQVDNNYNFEVGIIKGANIARSAINGEKIQNGSVGSQDLAPQSVGLTHLQNGGADGDLFQWNGTVWELINEADINITETDGIIGNEVLNATVGGSLVRSGGGTDTDPYTLDVSDGGIGNAELATNAVDITKMANNSVGTAQLVDDSVTADKINVDVAGTGLVQNGTTGALEVNNNTIFPDWANITNIPAGFDDNIDNDTQLTEAQVATAVNNQFPNLDTDFNDDFDGAWGNLTGVPA
ncbi:hypothetical protein, partial [Flagellimonas baculiformis]|uniref:hypothetical protein n=1 Tax=Flagellimonas baculiformis TaxID=3067310 RepID=UPI00384CA078